MWKPRYFDIGVNFSDPMFQGHYHSHKSKHPPDIDQVISRAQTFNVDKMLITGSSIAESEKVFKLVEQYGPNFASTVGVHPCSVAHEFYGLLENEQPLSDWKEKLDKLKELTEIGVSKGYVRAFGEIGLDYDRLHYSTVEQQKKMFQAQLEVVATLKHLDLPLFLHMRAACDDFVAILEPFLASGDIRRGNGVVHSFTGTQEELDKILELGFFVSVNGCSLKTQENLDVVRNIPMDRLLIETDAPWCEIRKSHASYPLISPYPNMFYPEFEQNGEKQENGNGKVQSKKQAIKMDVLLPFPTIKHDNYAKHQAAVQQKLENLGEAPESPIGEFAHPLIKSRNEPVFVGLVAEVMAGLYGLDNDDDIRVFVDTVYKNSCKLFKYSTV